jgi:hypothetical protein
MKEERELQINEKETIKIKEDIFKQTKYPASGRKLNENVNVKIRKGGKSLADYSDENYSLGQD